MKKSLLLSVVLSTILMATEPVKPAEVEVAAPDAPVETSSYGKFTANLRVQYFTRTFEESRTGDPDATAFNVGGIFKYESAEYNGFKFATAYYGSHRIGTFFTREEGIKTSMLDKNDGSDLAFIGEAYIQYTSGDASLKVGRQRLATPLANDRDLRMLPTSYEAAVAKYNGFSDTTLELAYITGTSGFTSKDNGFSDYDTTFGKDGIAYIYITNKSIEDLALSLQYAKTISNVDGTGANIPIEDYFYADMNYNIALGEKTYFKAQTGGNTYQNADNSFMYGAKLGTTVVYGIDLALVFNQIKDNSFKTIQAGPMYTDWQQGYGNYEPSTAFGGQIAFSPMTDLSLKFGYVDVSVADGYTKDDFSEFNFDGQYAINSYSSIRIRYSFKNQTDESIYNIPDPRDVQDRDDFRILYYLNF